MPGKLRKLLNSSRNIKAPYSIDDMSNHNGGLISFEYCGKKYNLAIRENALVFDNDMNLLYTFTFDELSTAETQFLKKVNEEIINHTNQKITLYINRATGIEKLTFTSLFDATYIFNKLKRVSYRSSESIGAIVNTVKTNKGSRLFSKNQVVENRDERNPEKTEYIASLSRVEDMIDNMICDNINKNGIQKSDERLDKCIELLQELRNNE